MKSLPLKYVGEDQPLYTTEINITVIRKNGLSEQIPISLRTYFEVDHVFMTSEETHDYIKNHLGKAVCEVIQTSESVALIEISDENTTGTLDPIDYKVLFQDLIEYRCSPCDAFRGIRRCKEDCTFEPIFILAKEVEAGNLSNISSVVSLSKQFSY